ncbi:putative glutamate receptor [Tachypleus tridentatus]|uniref:putative glutamate receptor n=1 Tax=Tachypleus tridentatus TaxID=6853 RepID=UPI003FD0211B
MIGMVHRKEVDLSVTQITITEERREAVDFTVPYSFDSVTFITSDPIAKHDTLAIIKPFVWQVWLCVFLSLTLVTICLTVINNINRNWKRQNPWTASLWYLWGCLVAQGGRIPSFKFCSVRIILVIWWLFAIVFVASYGGTLKSHMTILTKNQPIDTIYALEREVSQGRFTCGVFKGSFLEERLLNSKDPLYGVLGEPLRKDPSLFVKTHEEALLRTLKSDFACIDYQSHLEFEAAKMGEDKFSIAKDFFSSVTVGIALQKGCPYKKSFDRIIKRIVQAGLMKKWTDETEEDMRRNATDHRFEAIIRPLQVDDLLGAYVFLLIGHTMSTLVLFAEIVYSKLF